MRGKIGRLANEAQIGRNRVPRATPVLHPNWKAEWSKHTEADEVRALKVELIHIHTTADKKDAPYAYNGQRHWKELVTNANDEPWEGQEKKIVLTSSHTWMSRIKARLLCAETTDRLNKKEYTLKFCPGRVIRDEYTTNKSFIARTCQIMMDLNQRYPEFKPFKVFMSGTPIDSTPTDVLGTLTALHDPTWETDEAHEMHPADPLAFRRWVLI